MNRLSSGHGRRVQGLLYSVWVVLLVLAVTALPGCFSASEEVADTTSGTTDDTGNDDSSNDDSGSDIGASSDANLILETDSPQLLSGESGSVRIRANLKNASNNLMVDKLVEFSASSGSLQVIQPNTDESGNAIAILSSAHNPIPRDITVSATSEGSTASMEVAVTGTQLEVNGPTTAIALGGRADLTAKLKSGDGGVLKNEEITIASAQGNPLSATSIKTNDQGEAVVTVTDSTGSNDTLTVSALAGSVAATYTLEVSSDFLAFQSPDENAEIPLGSARTVAVKLLKGGASTANQAVSFSTTRGEFSGGQSSATAFTDTSGIANETISSDNAGGARITVSTDSESASRTVEFVAKNPASLVLEAAPNIVSFEETSMITATVRDARNNLVKGQKVLFSLDDITGGSLSLGEVRTNSLGQASSVYTAGSQSSGEGEVEVRADVAGNATVFGVTTLTVEPLNVRVAFGTGNEITELDAATYSQPYRIQVSDDGVPVAGVDVKLKVFPDYYYKGYHIAVDTNADGKPDTWYPSYTLTSDGATSIGPFAKCASEDLNRNGEFDPPVETDFNGDDALTPPAVAIIAESTRVPTVSKGVVTTDTNGFGHFNLVYPQEFAHWLEVELVAQTTQAGRETTFKSTTILTGLASDYTDIDASPPGANSPFGQSNTCANRE